ncbi:acylphosphatase [Bacillus sp. N9]
MKNLIAVHLLVRGRVQGVGFRFSTQQLAMEHRIKGWVKNTIDGNVEIVAEGEKANVDHFIKTLQSPPILLHEFIELKLHLSMNLKVFGHFK